MGVSLVLNSLTSAILYRSSEHKFALFDNFIFTLWQTSQTRTNEPTSFLSTTRSNYPPVIQSVSPSSAASSTPVWLWSATKLCLFQQIILADLRQSSFSFWVWISAKNPHYTNLWQSADRGRNASLQIWLHTNRVGRPVVR